MARRRIPRGRAGMLVQLLAIASTTSALSLQSFQIITSNQIPSSCIRAYSTEIDDCSRKDFTNGNQCSSDCVQGLQETVSRVSAACGTLDVDSRSLLGITLSGQLINALCPGFQATTVTLTVRPSTTQGFTTPIPVDITASSTTSTSETSTTSRTTTRVSQETLPPPVTSETTESPTESTTAAAATTTETTAQTTAQPVETPSATQSPTPDSVPNQGQDPGSGGGSPFDSVPALGLGTMIRPIGWHTPFLLAVSLMAAI